MFKELDKIHLAEAHWTFTSPAAMIGSVLTIFLIGMIIWKKCCSKSNPTEAIPPADSKPTPVTNNQATKIKCINPYLYQHLMKKLPKERERYWNNIQSHINDKLKLRREA
jgi:hypothetical protein